MINIRGRYNEGYADGYKVGVQDTKRKVNILLDEIFPPDKTIDNLKELIKELK